MGITLQSNRKWSKHIYNITSHGNKSLGFLKRNLKIANTEIKSRAHQTLVRPKLEYICSVEDPYTKDQQQKIEKVQRRAVRYAQTNYDYTSNTTAMLNTLQWPTSAECRLKTRIVLFHKIVHSLVAMPSHILVPTDSRKRQNDIQTFRQIQTTNGTYKCPFFPNTIIQRNMLSYTVITFTSSDCFR